MRIAYLCNRPYQLFNIISLISGVGSMRYMWNDIYIENTCGLDRLVPALKAKKIFSNIFIYNVPENKYRRRWIHPLYIYKRVKENMNPSSFLDSILCEKKKKIDYSYDCIFASTIEKLLLIPLYDSNKNVKVYFFEDGLASYVRALNKPTEGHSFLRKLFYMFTGKGSLHNIDIKALYVYKPDLVMGPALKKIYPIPKPQRNLVASLKTIFSYHYDEIYETARICYLDQGLSNEMISNERLLKVIQILLSVGGKDFVFRGHPKLLDESCILCQGNNDVNNECWELLSRDFSENLILCSVHSSAMLTPYFIFGKKNPLIFLYKILLNNPDYNRVDLFIRRLMHEREDVYIPNTVQEFVEILDSLLNRNA